MHRAAPTARSARGSAACPRTGLVGRLGPSEQGRAWATRPAREAAGRRRRGRSGAGLKLTPGPGATLSTAGAGVLEAGVRGASGPGPGCWRWATRCNCPGAAWTGRRTGWRCRCRRAGWRCRYEEQGGAVGAVHGSVGGGSGSGSCLPCGLLPPAARASLPFDRHRRPSVCPPVRSCQTGLNCKAPLRAADVWGGRLVLCCGRAEWAAGVAGLGRLSGTRWLALKKAQPARVNPIAGPPAPQAPPSPAESSFNHQ